MLDRIKHDMKFSLQNNNNYVACTNFILAFYYDDFYNLVNIAPIPTIFHLQMIEIALLIEKIKVSTNHNILS